MSVLALSLLNSERCMPIYHLLSALSKNTQYAEWMSRNDALIDITYLLCIRRCAIRTNIELDDEMLREAMALRGSKARRKWLPEHCKIL